MKNVDIQDIHVLYAYFIGQVARKWITQRLMSSVTLCQVVVTL